MKLKPINIPFSMFSTRSAEPCNQAYLLAADERFYDHLKQKHTGNGRHKALVQRKNRPRKHKMIGEV